jgi:hypothetical protein
VDQRDTGDADQPADQLDQPRPFAQPAERDRERDDRHQVQRRRGHRDGEPGDRVPPGHEADSGREQAEEADRTSGARWTPWRPRRAPRSS